MRPFSRLLVDRVASFGDGDELAGQFTGVDRLQKVGIATGSQGGSLRILFGIAGDSDDVDVARVDGAPRVEARVSRTLTFASGGTPRLLWLHGAESRFDRLSIRLSHAADERHRKALIELANRRGFRTS